MDSNSQKARAYIINTVSNLLNELGYQDEWVKEHEYETRIEQDARQRFEDTKYQAWVSYDTLLAALKEVGFSTEASTQACNGIIKDMQAAKTPFKARKGKLMFTFSSVLDHSEGYVPTKMQKQFESKLAAELWEDYKEEYKKEERSI